MTLTEFIRKSPTTYHSTATAAAVLDTAGYTPLCEADRWKLEAGGKYYVTRNGSSLIAFCIPEGDFTGYMMAAAHGDSPCPKVKTNPELLSKGYIRISTETYGGMLLAPWLDRPLSVAGRVAVRTDSGFEMKLIDFSEPVCIIPNLCPHLQNNANKDINYNKAVDMIPLYGDDSAKGDFETRVASLAGVSTEDVISCDLFVYNPQEGINWNGFVSSPRLDDLQSAYGLLEGFLKAKPGGALPVYCLFDNEEVGSGTKQGAAGSFLKDTLNRIGSSLQLTDDEKLRKLACSFMVSCDNAHAVHPNHPEVTDANNGVYMNKGIVIKHNANQSYTTDAVSNALFRTVCGKAGVPVQDYTNRADQRGGSTLGNISTSQVSVNTVDIGLAQLAMHSCFETAGEKDTEYLIAAMETYFSGSLKVSDNSIEFCGG